MVAVIERTATVPIASGKAMTGKLAWRNTDLAGRRSSQPAIAVAINGTANQLGYTSARTMAAAIMQLTVRATTDNASSGDRLRRRRAIAATIPNMGNRA